MKLDLTPLLTALERIEQKLDKILDCTPRKVEDPIEPKPIEPPKEEPLPPIADKEIIDISDNFIGRNDIKLEAGKHYKFGLIKTQMLLNRHVKIYCDDPVNKPILEFGVENYSPQLHGNQDSFLFLMADNSSLLIENVDICQPKQIITVETFNPRILNSIQQPNATWTAVIKNCDTTRLGNHGGFGLGFMYGSPKENHVALIDFKHFGTGLMDAKNPYENGVLYVTMRNVETYARDDAKLSRTDFKHTASLKDNILTFDGNVFSLTSGYNWNWQDNDAYIVLYDRYTFFLDGYKGDTVVSQNQFKLRPQAKGMTKFNVLSNTELFSNEFEMHAGDKFDFDGVEYTVISKDRIKYPWFDSRTWETKENPERGRSIVYKLDKVLSVSEGVIEINYKGDQIEFTDTPITLLYKGNGGFRTTVDSKYRANDMLNSRGIGHLSYNHSDISMDAANVKHLGFYRGSEKGNGRSLIWNLYNCEGFEDSGVWFNPAIPVTNNPDLPIPDRIKVLIE